MTDFLSIIKPPDGGLVYAETNLHHFFPEPLNTITSCFFFVLAVYWIIRLKLYSPKHSFLSVCSWLLLTGSIGGTIYHGLRKYPVFIPLDWVPILLLCLMASFWFWTKLFKSRVYSIGILAVFFLIQYPINRVYEGKYSHLLMNLNYALMALMVLVPLTLYQIKIHFVHGKWVLLALASFITGLFFRIADNWGWLPIGTHFLWHTFGAIAAASMFLFIYKINERPDISSSIDNNKNNMVRRECLVQMEQ